MVIVIALIAAAVIVSAIILFTDFDGDGLANITEFRLGTSAFNSDTDGDGLNDGLEVNIYETKPLVADTDTDGLNDGQEVDIYGTNPLVIDTDNDGLGDGTEVNTHKTDPTVADTDNDNLKDGLEVNGWSITVDNLTQQVTSNPLSMDSDEDNLSDWGEYAIHLTNPNSTDTDGDNLNDWLEINIHGTKAVIADTDADNLDDGLEINTYRTNPLLTDTDNDGIHDGLEVTVHGTNPIDNDTDNDGLLDGIEVNGWSITVNGLSRHVTSDSLSSDSDGDNLSDWDERHTYGTDPSSTDTDNDSLDDWSETKTYGTDPRSVDTDNDGLKDEWEVHGYDADGDNIIDVDLPALGANPLVKDIFVEVDWMPSWYEFGTATKNVLVEKFSEHGIVLHIDDGEIGGGTVIDESVDVIYTEPTDGPMNDIYDFKSKYFKRQGVFYWALVSEPIFWVENEYLGNLAFDGYFTITPYTQVDFMKTASTFMHELGHCLGLNPGLFDGIDSEKYSFDEYRSVMNYNSINDAPEDFCDYSSGPPFNDWEALNLAESLALTSA